MCPPAPSGHIKPLYLTGVGFQALIDGHWKDLFCHQLAGEQTYSCWSQEKPVKGLAATSLQAQLILLLHFFQKRFFLPNVTADVLHLDITDKYETSVFYYS